MQLNKHLSDNNKQEQNIISFTMVELIVFDHIGGTPSW